ncbi:MAG: hypothetical protein J6T16_05970 [Opitutales bacterium]|nr:hypothetical protein [Opitutales bacterium]
MSEARFTAEEIDTIRKMAAREGEDAIREKCEKILKGEEICDVESAKLRTLSSCDVEAAESFYEKFRGGKE